MAKIEAGQILLEQQPCSLAQCIAEAVSPLAPQASDKSLRLDWHVASTVPDTLLGDAARMRHVLINLIGNAVKFTEAGEVRVEITADSTRHLTLVKMRAAPRAMPDCLPRRC